MDIVHKSNSQKVLGFISTEGVGGNVSGETYLSRYPDNFSNVGISPVVPPHILGVYFNA